MSAVMLANHDRLKKCVDRDIPPWLVRFRENFESAQQETGNDLASSPPAGAAGACRLPKSLDATSRPAHETISFSHWAF